MLPCYCSILYHAPQNLHVYYVDFWGHVARCLLLDLCWLRHNLILQTKSGKQVRSNQNVANESAVSKSRKHVSLNHIAILSRE